MKISIVSRQYKAYIDCLNQHNLIRDFNLQLQDATDCVSKIKKPQQVEVLLANPTLIAEHIETFHNLSWFQSTWAGVNALTCLDKKNYRLTGIKNVFGQKMTEYVFSYLLYQSRNLEAYNQSNSAKQWDRPDTYNLYDKTIGIMGLGNIGESIAKTAKTFGMKVFAYNLSSQPEIADECFAPSKLSQFAAQCDVILNLLPETTNTLGICDKNFFCSMKKGSIFINAGRGSAIKNEMDLCDALKCGHLRYAAIDVCKVEPLPKDHAFWTTKNLFISNHTAAMGTPKDVFSIFHTNLMRYTKQQPLINQIDFNKGY